MSSRSQDNYRIKDYWQFYVMAVHFVVVVVVQWLVVVGVVVMVGVLALVVNFREVMKTYPSFGPLHLSPVRFPMASPHQKSSSSFS